MQNKFVRPCRITAILPSNTLYPRLASKIVAMALYSSFSKSVYPAILPIAACFLCHTEAVWAGEPATLKVTGAEKTDKTDKLRTRAEDCYQRSFLLEGRGDLHGALSEATAAIKICPRLIRYHVRRADIFEQLGMYREANSEYKRALNIVPSPGVDAGREYFHRAEAYYRLKNYPGAQASLFEATKRGFKTHRVYRLIGKIAFKQGQYKKSIHYLDLAIKAKPTPTSFLYKSRCYRAQSMFQKSLESLNQAEACGVATPSVIIEKALVLYRLKKISESKKVYVQWRAERDRDFLLYPDWKSFVHYCETDQKIDYYGRLIKLSKKNNAAPLYERAILNFDLARYHGAAKEMEQYLTMTSWKGRGGVSAACYANIGYRLSGRSERAQSLDEKAVSRLNKNVWPYPVYLFLRKSLSSKELLSRARTNQQLTVANFFIGLVQLLHGKDKEAMASQKKALDLQESGLDEYALAEAEFHRLKHRLSLSKKK